MKSVGLVIASTVAWAWALLAGIGGLALLVHQGPLPITNGWFCAVLRHRRVSADGDTLEETWRRQVPLHVQLTFALLIFIVGRVAVVVLLHRPFLPEYTGVCW